MKLAELKQIVDAYYNMSEANHKLEVCIPNSKREMGGTPVTNVQFANKGIDWDKGKFLLIPESKMIEKPKD